MRPRESTNGTWTWKRGDSRRFLAIYEALFKAFGPQGWWPGETPFEVMVGAILTQNTNWRNVERAIANLKGERALTPARLADLPPARLAQLLRPAGYFRVKASRLGNLLTYLKRRHGGSVRRMLATSTDVLREDLLSVNGVGPETADSILLYAAGRPVFVVDAYTRRIFARHGLVRAQAPYDEIQAVFQRALPAATPLFNEYHALIVRLGKDYCRPGAPRCATCPLGEPPPV